MYFIYVLKSLSSNHYYVGQTSNLEKRLELHNSGKVYWTSRHLPWSIIYSESYNTKIEAVKREKYLKSHAGRNWIKSNIDGPVA